MPDSSAAAAPVGERTLVVMRHGRAEQFATEDHQRRLTDRGAREALDAGKWLVARGLAPTHALVSSAQRTRETWRALSAVLTTPVEPVVDEAIYAASPESAVERLRRTPAGASVLVYVGHNPTAASLAHLLDDGDPDPESFRELSLGFSTSALAVLDVHVPWSELDEATARLVAFYPGQH